MEKMKQISVIFAGILTLLPVNVWLCNFLDGYKNVSNDMYANSFFLVQSIGLIIYETLQLKPQTENEKRKSNVAILGSILMFLTYISYINVENLGFVSFNWFGIAFTYALKLKLFLSYICYRLTILTLFILYIKNFLPMLNKQNTLKN